MELLKSSQKALFIAITVCQAYIASQSCSLASRPCCDIFVLTMSASRRVNSRGKSGYFSFFFFKISLNSIFLPLCNLFSFLPYFTLNFSHYSSDSINFSRKFYIKTKCHQGSPLVWRLSLSFFVWGFLSRPVICLWLVMQWLMSSIGFSVGWGGMEFYLGIPWPFCKCFSSWWSL